VPTFYKMKNAGVGPRVTQPPGAPPRITAEADAEWLERANNLTLAAEAARLSEKRRGRARSAAAKAIESPKHISRRKRA
jgi:hypothetical protein